MLKNLLLLSSLFLLLLRVQYAAAESPRPPVAVVADHEIKGLVTDSSGTPLPGVTLMVKNKTSVGTTTDINGRYILVVPDDAVIIVRMIGFQEQEIPANGRSTINIVMKPSTNNLNETVVVAYGTQKKKEVVGSVTSINVEDLKVPSSNLTTALAGRAAGLIAFQRSGEPGADNADFFIRGVTTFGYKQDPLILIDGVELTTDDLARLRPDDIESFSIMKDATSTALYGARGANGVILVTTKRGKQGPAKVNLRIENSFTAPTKNIEVADPVTFMKLSNEAALTRGRLNELPYSEDKIESTAAGKNPLIYPANDWHDLLFKKYSTSQRANLNVSGGGNVARYFISGSYTKDNGMLKVDRRNNFNSNININRYTFRANVDVDLTKSTTLTIRASGNFDDYRGPLPSGAVSGGSAMYNAVMHSNPVRFPAFYPIDAEHWYVKHIMFGNEDRAANGNGTGFYLNPYAVMVQGYKDESRSFMSAQSELKQTLDFVLPGLNFRTMVNVNRTSNFAVQRSYIPFWYGLTGYNKQDDTYSITQLNPTQGTEYLNYFPSPTNLNAILYWESALSYSHSMGDHTVSGMLINILRTSIDPGGSSLQESLPHRNSGLSGRVTYNYASKYFAEFNFGYNGSERFDGSHRFGFFPSAGLAWTISNEEFLKPYSKSINNLKLRATYGLVGNDAVGSDADRFFYLSDTNPNDAAKGAVFGRDNTYSRNGYTVRRYSNPDITWEKSYQSNIALELGLFNKLTFTGEYYTSQRKDILMNRANNPTTMGLADTVQANVGQAYSRGTDLSLNYNTTLPSGMWIEVMGNFTYATGRYKVYEEPEYLPNEKYRSRIDYPVSQRWGYIAERLFVDDEEARNSPRQFGEYGGGDIKYTDVNRDGQITPADMVPIGYPDRPEITYGFGFSAGYKNFDLSAFFQGSARETFWIDQSATAPFVNETALLKAYADNHWSEDNRNVHALWPRLSQNFITNNQQNSTWFMRDGSFLRLKQVELGYNVPKSFQRRLHTSTLRLYFNATNLFVLSRFKLWDVEMGGRGLGYPLQRVLNIGVNITFN